MAGVRRRGRGLLFSYVWGSPDKHNDVKAQEIARDICGVFLRTFVATSSPDTDLVIMQESAEILPPCANAYATVANIHFVRAPT